MDYVLGYVTVRLEILFAGFLGPAADRVIVGSVTWADITAVACYLAFAATVSAVVTLMGPKGVSPTSSFSWTA